ncbi:HTTM domain-containing protein [Streptomyces sp. V4-01]|uniref:HTTM domain-containing protein n=1 Tax=Actinacidiphila polyblastidii TaxID=3110430 RepID=A0ABU7PJ51_9ACTN|nr:HTTM domain-containing protein [Streptomyces sp. V4-01]
MWSAGLDRAFARGLRRVTGSALAPYQSAVVRIGFALVQLLFLLREFPHRDELYGPGSPWGLDLARRLIAGNHAFTVLLWSDSRAWFEIVYALSTVSAVTLLLGWRTRTSSLIFMVGVLSLQNRNVFMGDGGDNVIHIMAIYLLFTRCAQVWSLDHRRTVRAAAAAAAKAGTEAGTEAEAGAGRKAAAEAGTEARAEAAPQAGTATEDRNRAGARVPRAADLDPVGIALWAVLGAGLVAATLAGKLSTGWATAFWACWIGQAVWWAVRRYAPGEPRTVLETMGDIVHNGAMLVIVAEVCLIYSTAGWYKIQGSRWQDGTALYYPLHLDDFTPWPALSHALAGNDVMVMLITYGTVIVQVAFPFTLFNRRVKNVLLACMMLEHASIALILGLPFFSLAMIAADAVFLPTGFLRWLAQRIAGAVRGPRAPEPARVRDSGAAGLPEPAAGPPPAGAVAGPS